MSDLEGTRGTPTGGAGNDSREATARASAVSLIEEGNVLEEQGRPDEAMARYEAAVQRDPRCARAHLNRGNILLSRDRIEEAREAYQLAIACDQKYAAAYFNLGNLNNRAREYEQALGHYGKATRIKPDFADAFVAMGNAFADLGRTGEARESYQHALAITPDYGDVHFNLGLLAMRDGARSEALECCKRAIELGASSPMAHHVLTALKGEDAGAIPGALVTGLFDDYASRFDSNLVDTLNYSAPRLMREAVGRVAGGKGFRHALDLGCGTGLIGVHFRDVVHEIDGVDLSPKMLQQARRKQIYNRLDCDDIVAWLERAARELLSFDIVLSADVFIYVGNLEPAFKAVRAILAKDGLFVFSVETLERGSFELRPTFRYAHSSSYVRERASAHGFVIALAERINLRKESSGMIEGAIYVLTRST